MSNLDPAHITAEHASHTMGCVPSNEFTRQLRGKCTPYLLAADLAEADRKLAAVEALGPVSTFPAAPEHWRVRWSAVLAALSGHEHQNRPQETTGGDLRPSQPSGDQQDPETPTDDGVALGEYPDLPPCTTGGRHLLSDTGRCARCGASA